MFPTWNPVTDPTTSGPEPNNYTEYAVSVRNLLMVFRKTVAVYTESYKTSKFVLWKKNVAKF